MRLQELKLKETVRNDEATEKRIRVFLQSSFYTLHGTWRWEMGTDYIFCSDVLFFPQDEAIGTKAIFHPDDVAGLKEVLASGELITSFSFRIITTYGEVKMLTGENIAVAQELTADWQQQAVQTAAEDLEQKTAQTHLQLLKELDSRTGRFTVTGRWYYNSQTHETWYSDYVYQLHGFPAQGLNPHLHTFHPFVHPDDKAVVMEYTNKAFQERAPLHMDYRILVGDTEKWVSYKAFWFYGERGEAILGGILQDVTEQKRAEKELETFRNVVQFQRQQLAFDEQQVAFGHWQVALLTRKTTYSDQYYRIFGLKPQSLAPTITAFLNYVHPDDREKVEAANRRLMYEHALPDLEYRIVRNDGKIRHLVQKAKLVTVEDELVVMGIIQDVTVQRMLEKKVAEGADALQLRSWLAQQADEQAGMMSWIMDLDENSITWSDSFTKLAGYFRQQPTNITEKTLFAMVHPHDLKLFRAQWRQAVEERQATSFDVRFLVRGAVQYMKAMFNVYSQAEKAYFIGTVQNRTAEQVLQQQLSQRVQLAESLAENTFNRVIITDIHNTILLWNRAAEEAYGLKRADAIGQNFFDVFPHLKTEEEMQAFYRVHRGEKVVQEAVLSVLGRGYYNLHLVPVYQDEKVSGILHIIQDVTAEVRLRNSLNERLQLIESLVEASVDRIIALDRNLNYLYWNKSAEDYYGITKEAVLGKNILEVFPALVNDPSYGEIRRALRGETVHIPPSPEAEVFFETYLIPIKDERGEVMSLLWMAHDLSNEYVLQQQQRKALHVMNSVNAVFIELDNEFRFRFLNKTAEHYLGRSHDELLGKVMWEEFPQAMGAPGYDAILKGVTEKTSAETEYFSDFFLKWVYLSVVPTQDGILLFFYDRQDIKEAQQKLQESHALLATSEEVAQAGSYEADLQTMAFRFSDGMCRLFGEEPRSFTPSLEFVDSRSHPDDVAPVRTILEQAVIDKKPYHYTRRIYRRDGELRTLEAHGNVVCDAEGNPVKLVGLVQDITERQQAEAALQESRQLIEQVMEASPDFIMVFNLLTNKIDYINRSGYKGNDERYYETLAIDYKNLLERAHPDDREALHQYIDRFRTASDGDLFTFEYRVVHGEEVTWYRSRGKVFKRDKQGNPTHYISNVQDITERRKAEQQIEEQSHFLRRISETIPDMVSIMELPSRKLRYLNNSTFATHGFDTETMDARNREEQAALVHPDSVETLEAYFQQLSTASDEEIVSAEYKAKNDSGEWMWFHVRGKVFQRDSAGNVTQVLNAIENITRRKRVEEALHASKELLQSVFDASPNSIMLLKPLYDGNGGVEDFEILMFNQYTQRTNRISDAEVIGKRYTELFPNTISTGIVDRFKEVVTTGREADWEYAYEAEGVVQGWFRSIASKSGDLLLVTSENITERKRAEEQILQLKDEIAKKATDKYLRLFNSIDEGFYQCEVIFDEENNPIDILYLEENPAAVRIIGASFAGKTLKEINPAYESYWYQIWGDVALTGESQRLEKYSAPDKKWFDFYISKVGSTDSRQVAVVFQDITERKKAEAALQEVNARLTDVLESTTDAFYAVDADFNFTYVNSKAAQLWKRSPESLIGKHYWTEFPAAVGSESYHKHKEVLQSGKSAHYETLSPLVGIWIKVNIYPGKDGGLAVFFHDISERKRAEENLKNFAATLEQQVAERTKELQNNLAILQQAEDLAQMGSWEYEITTGKFNWSEGMYRLFGLSQGSRVQAEVYLDFAAEEDRTVAKRIVKHLKKHHQPFEETMHIKRGTEIRLLKITSSVVSDEQGKPQRIVGVDLDITEQKQAEEKVKETQHWLQQTAQASPDAINVYDLHRKQPFFLNNCLANWLDTSSEELVRIGINGRLEMVHPDDRLRLLHFNEKIKAANDGQVLTLDYRLRKKDGTLLWLRNRAKVFQRDAKGAVTHILSILQDITEEKAAEQVLTALNASLEKKNVELESKNEEITSFAFVASHDLKEPLRKIHTFSDWLLTKETGLSENGRVSLQKMTGAVKRLDQLIDDILALTKVHVDKERIKKVELQQVLERAKEEMQERLQSTGTIIESEDLPVINGMENPLLYLFKNLISNSIKFQTEDSVPVISIRWKRENEFLKISFTDNGIGIAPEYHKKIFEMFRRLHSRTEYEGTGMGLAICKRIMEKHGGKITVESEAGKGATFACWFPAALSTV